MCELQFCVDDQLRIMSCGEGFGDGSGTACEGLLGLSYDHLLPKLVHNDQDALDWVLKTGKEIVLEQVPLNGSISPAVGVADLRIIPLQDDGCCCGVRVLIKPRPESGSENKSSPLRRSEEMEKLVIMLSHGVRNPLNAIKGAVSYLQSRYAHEPELGEFTGIMSEEIVRLERFVSGFLATSCFDQAVVSLDINALLKKILLYTSLQARVAGVEISLDCAPALPLLVNPFQVEQAILNLLNNAIAALPRGGQVCLSTEVVEDQGEEWVVIKVADNGPGMSPAKIASLKDPTTTPERGRERGFGLFITREVVQAYGGHMKIESEAGVGTVVSLVLPAADQGEPA